MENEFKNLFKTDEGSSVQQPKLSEFEYCKRKINGILNSLSKPVDEYNPSKTVNSISDYQNKGKRIIYSELTNRVYAMTEDERGTISTNLDSLLNYVMDEENGVQKETVNTALRLWDHFNLACCQLANTKNVLGTSAEETKSDLHRQLYKKLYEELSSNLHKQLFKQLYRSLYDKFKGIEKEYITILGIFASVVLAFVGGLAYSTSVLQHMSGVSIYRLVIVILLLGFVLINTINILLRDIFVLNGNEKHKMRIWPINVILLGLMIVVAVSWGLSVHSLLPAFETWFHDWVVTKMCVNTLVN